jgi:hypothetical protein
MSTLSKAIYKFNVILTEISVAFLSVLLDPIIHMELQSTLKSQINLEKE